MRYEWNCVHLAGHKHAVLRKGKSVSLRRSRIPIIGGELFSSTTRPVNIFVLSYVVSIVRAFFVSFGVNGATEPYPVTVLRDYVTRMKGNATVRKDSTLKPRFFGFVLEKQM